MTESGLKKLNQLILVCTGHIIPSLPRRGIQRSHGTGFVLAVLGLRLFGPQPLPWAGAAHQVGASA